MIEIWQIVARYRNYAVSTFGRVRNLNTGRLLKHQSSKRGGNYAFVNLYRNGKRLNINVHMLVALTFMVPPPPGKIIHHKDTNRMNPRLDNLEHLTQKENSNAGK